MSRTALSAGAKALGCFVERVQIGEAHPRNGNAYGTTPVYSYVARKGWGVAGLLGTYNRHSDAVGLCNDYAVDASQKTLVKVFAEEDGS